jgi:hypothetical protein
MQWGCLIQWQFWNEHSHWDALWLSGYVVVHSAKKMIFFRLPITGSWVRNPNSARNKSFNFKLSASLYGGIGVKTSYWGLWGHNKCKNRRLFFPEPGIEPRTTAKLEKEKM